MRLDWMVMGLLLAAYLLGAVTFAPLVCRAAGLPDPRLGGSKNPGATNVLRLGGKFYAALVLLLDALKGAAPVAVAIGLGCTPLEQTLVLLAAMLGHIFPIYFSFQGGKGIATFLGGLWVLSPTLGAVFVGTWLVVFAVARISALSALLALLTTIAVAYWLSHSPLLFVLAALLLWTHRENWRRLWSGQEKALKGPKGT